MTAAVSTHARYPKTARLLTRRDFQFPSFHRLQTEGFNLVYNSEGSGRLGISISKKCLKRAVARNRVRRLIKEAFRTSPELRAHVDLHVIGRPALAETWRTLDEAEVQRCLGLLVHRISRGGHAKAD